MAPSLMRDQPSGMEGDANCKTEAPEATQVPLPVGVERIKVAIDRSTTTPSVTEGTVTSADSEFIATKLEEEVADKARKEGNPKTPEKQKTDPNPSTHTTKKARQSTIAQQSTSDPPVVAARKEGNPKTPEKQKTDPNPSTRTTKKARQSTIAQQSTSEPPVVAARKEGNPKISEKQKTDPNPSTRTTKKARQSTIAQQSTSEPPVVAALDLVAAAAAAASVSQVTKSSLSPNKAHLSKGPGKQEQQLIEDRRFVGLPPSPNSRSLSMKQRANTPAPLAAGESPPPDNRKMPARSSQPNNRLANESPPVADGRGIRNVPTSTSSLNSLEKKIEAIDKVQKEDRNKLLSLLQKNREDR